MWKRLSWVLVFTSLSMAVFYLGFLYGNREREAQQNPNTFITYNNKNTINSISDIEERNVYGFANVGNIVEKKVYGKLYFIVSNNTTEIAIKLENVPLELNQPQGKEKVRIPDSLKVQYALQVVNGSDSLATFEYINLRSDNEVSLLNFGEITNGTRSGKFSGIINRKIEESNNNTIKRIVLRSVDDSVQNIFIDQDSDLPAKIRGNSEINPPLSGEPSPFFWAIF
jgi:hypothetical protein